VFPSGKSSSQSATAMGWISVEAVPSRPTFRTALGQAIAAHVRKRSHAKARRYGKPRAVVVLEFAFPVAVHDRHATGLNARITTRRDQIEAPVAVDVPKRERIVVEAGLQLHDRRERETTPAVAE
jgi:hypothetical protein